MIFTLSLSAFVTDSTHPLGLTHDATWWQVSETSDFSGVLIVDTGWDTVNLLSIEVDVPGFSYARAKFRDELELDSLFSIPTQLIPYPDSSYGGGDDDFINTPVISDCLED